MASIGISVAVGSTMLFYGSLDRAALAKSLLWADSNCDEIGLPTEPELRARHVSSALVTLANSFDPDGDDDTLHMAMRAVYVHLSRCPDDADRLVGLHVAVEGSHARMHAFVSEDDDPEPLDETTWIEMVKDLPALVH